MPHEFESNVHLRQHLYPVYVRQGRSPKKYKTGFIDAAGNLIIEPRFEDARPFYEGLASAFAHPVSPFVRPKSYSISDGLRGARHDHDKGSSLGSELPAQDQNRPPVLPVFQQPKKDT
jgi:hypothetical protein